MMMCLVTGPGMDGPWVIVRDSVYLHAVVQADGGIFVRTIVSGCLGTEVLWKE